MTIPKQAPPPLKVLDLTHYVAGPYCTKLLAGFGAEVTKVERPVTGDGMRSVGPFVDDEEHPEKSIPFLWLNTGKKGITLNLKAEAGREVLLRLVAEADIIIENFSPSVMPRLKLGYETLRQANPAVIMASISNFGQTGPYRDFKADEIVAYAVSGLMQQTGDPARPPLRAGPSIAQYSAGMLAYIATLMAVYQREHSGLGQHIDVSIQEAALDNIEISLMECLRLGKVANRTADEHALVPWQIFPCRDGYAAVIGGPIRHWLEGARLFEEPRLLEERYRHAADRIAHRDEVKALVQPWLTRHAKQEIYHLGQASRLAFGYLASLVEVYASPQLQQRHFWAEANHPVAGSQQYCGPPFRPSETPWRHGRAPLLGEHNQEVLRERLGYSVDVVEGFRKEGII
jgi:crotonobetainyl-CoA:carnitine CoA-transferase CaiB-like acyl-CoA transferase